MPSIRVEFELDEQFIWDILTTFVESGYSDWFVFTDVRRDPDTLDVLAIAGVIDPDEGQPYQQVEVVELDDVAIGLQNLLDGSCPVATDILDHIARGVRESDAGEVDAIGADCVIQSAVFGQLIYG